MYPQPQRDSDEICQYCSQTWNFYQVKKILRIALPLDTVITTLPLYQCCRLRHHRHQYCCFTLALSSVQKALFQKQTSKENIKSQTYHG